MELTPRQKYILQMLVDGKTPKQIALSLQISTKTVDKHLTSARRKYGVSSRAEMIARAVAWGDVYVFLGEIQIGIGLTKRAVSLSSSSENPDVFFSPSLCSPGLN